jgi:hypothetical protein
MFERESEEGAQISSNSWGWSSGGGSIRDYNTNAAMWDEGVWDADNVGSPGTAKNVITVGNNETDRGAGGACGSFSGLGDNIEEMNASSSRGPVDPDGTGQGLFKPDVTNIGGYWNVSVEALGTASACSAQTVNPDCPTDCSDTGPSYAYSNGTSMSAPLTAGFGGVVLQDLVVNRGVAAPRPSLIKALLINGARDLTPSACNYTFDVSQSVVHEGWGFVQAGNTLYGPGGTPAVRNIEFENEETGNALATGENTARQVTITAGAPFRVNLAWTDFPAGAGSGSPLVVNDLDLEVSGPDGTFLGNNFTGNWSATGGGADRYNVAENVYIQNPTGGTYTITVKGFQVSQDQEPGKAGINQDYSLVWSGDLSVCTPTCGDNVAECGELCDGTDLGGATCSGQGCTGGSPSCTVDCFLDISTKTASPVPPIATARRAASLPAASAAATAAPIPWVAAAASATQAATPAPRLPRRRLPTAVATPSVKEPRAVPTALSIAAPCRSAATAPAMAVRRSVIVPATAALPPAVNSACAPTAWTTTVMGRWIAPTVTVPPAPPALGAAWPNWAMPATPTPTAAPTSAGARREPRPASRRGNERFFVMGRGSGACHSPRPSGQDKMTGTGRNPRAEKIHLPRRLQRPGRCPPGHGRRAGAGVRGPRRKKRGARTCPGGDPEGHR